MGLRPGYHSGRGRDTMTTSAGTKRVAVPEPGTYRLDPDRSVVRLAAKHMFGLGTAKAQLRIRDGELRVADSVTDSTAYAVISAASFASDKKRRDTHVTSAALLDVEKYPDITFRSSAVRPAGEQWVLSGTLTAHGTDQPAEVTIDTASSDPDGVRLHAEARVDRYAFGVTKVKGMAGRHIDLDFDLLAVKVTAAA